jgi:fatty-acyl-CoA synthase/long-chain acyl-CoA synthetase
VWYDPLLINGYVVRNATRFPDRLALVDGSRRLTYSELVDRVSRLASGLESSGLGYGQRLALLAGNCVEYAECLLACCWLGAIAVPVNWRLTTEEIAGILADVEPTIVVSSGAFSAALAESGRGVASIARHLTLGAHVPGAAAAATADYEEAIASAAVRLPGRDIDPCDAAFILYTSGTTGRAKGAVLSHAGYVVNSLSVLARLRITDSAEWRHVGVPMFHSGGLNSVLQQLILGGTGLISEPGELDGAMVAELFERFPVATAFFAPTQWRQVCDDPGISARRFNLRRLIWGTSHTPREVLDRMSETFPGLPVFAQFGQTEMSGTTCTLDPEFAAVKLGSVGRPLSHVQLRLVDEEMKDVPAGSVGEIIYQGPSVMRGYWRDGEATSAAFRGGWFHSGDLGRFDADGFLYVVGRLKDIIVSGGENIYGLEVESALQSHPKVAEVAVIAVPHAKWVESPRAVIVPRDPDEPPTLEELVEHLRPRLASYKKPTSLRIVASLPKNAMGKVVKPRVSELYGQPDPDAEIVSAVKAIDPDARGAQSGKV